MMTLSVYPLGLVVVEILWLKIVRVFKLKMEYNGHENNDSDYLKFMELVAGPEYPFHLKSSSTTVLLFISISMGIIFPILYPLALFGVILQYLTNKYTLAKLYRAPPIYSVGVTNLNSLLLLFSPLILTFSGVCVLGVEKMFSEKPNLDKVD
jgi:hypothetical protein